MEEIWLVIQWAAEAGKSGRPKLGDVTNKEDGKKISNIVILMKEGSVWINITGVSHG